MNVENRKLFRNKDARARLAGMGGIIASSPELLGTVQKFAKAGEVKVNSITGPLRDAFIEQTINGVYGIREQEKAIASALAGGYGPEVQADTMRKALAGVFGEDIKTKAQTIEPIYSSEVNDTPPVVSDTPPVLFQPNVSPDTFSSEFMINQQAPQSVVSPLYAAGLSISGMPLVEPSGSAIDAGPVVPSTFLVQLPGLIGGNEFLQLTAAELQLLNEKQPGLMSSEGVMIQEATPEILATLNPAQYNTTNNPNIKRMFADLGVTLPESSVEAEGPSVIDRLKSIFVTEESPPQSETTPVTRLPMNTAADSGLEGELFSGATGGANMMPPPPELSKTLEPRSGIRTLLDRVLTRGKAPDRDPRVARETPGFMDSDAGSVMGFSPEISPEMAQELEILEQARDAQEFAGGFGQTAKKFAEAGLESANIAGGILGSGSSGLIARGLDTAGYVTGAFPNVSKPLFRLSDKMDEFKKNYYGALVGQDNYFPRMYTSPELPVSEAELLSQEAAAKQEAIAKQSLAAIENADPSVLSEGAPTELTPSAKAAASVTRMSEQGMPKGLSAEAIERIQSQITADKEMDAAGQRLIAGQPREVGPVEVDPQPVDDRNLLEKGIDLVKEGFDKYKVNRASEDAATSLEDLKTTALEFGPGDLTPEKVAEINKQIQTEKENTIIAEEVKPGDVEEAMKLAEPSDGSVTSTGSGDGKDKPTTTSSLYADYKKEILAALGGEKKDKNKEKWEDFSLAMFRIAAGKDPSAVANIAAGLAQSAEDKKTDRSVQQERDDRINLLALKMSQEEKLAGLRAGSIYEKIPTFSEAVLDEMTSIRSNQGPIAVPLTESELRSQALKTVGSLPAYSKEYRKYLTTTDGNKQQYLPISPEA